MGRRLCWAAAAALLGFSWSGPAKADLPQPKSESKALRWSALGTAVPVAVGGALLLLDPKIHHPPAGPDSYGYDESRVPPGVSILVMTGGAVLGPALGHIYAGRTGRGLGGVAIRTGGVGLAYVSLIALVADESGDTKKFAALFFGGLGFVAAHSVFDIAMAPRSARKWNGKHDGVKVGLGPAVAPGGSPGVALRVGF